MSPRRPGRLLAPRQIWRDVLAGRVDHAIRATRAARALDSKGEIGNREGPEPVALYLEPSLTSSAGHQAGLAACYADLLARLGHRTVVVHARRCTLPARADWHPFFLVPHHTLALRGIESEAELERVTRYFASEFGAAIRGLDPALCVFGTIRFTNVAAAVAAVQRANRAPRCRTIFGVMEAGEVPDCADPGIVRSAFTRAAKSLRRNATRHLLIAETDSVRDFLLDCGFAQGSVRVYPYVAAKNIVTQVERADDAVRVGYLGGSRPVRNPELIADLLTPESLAEEYRWCVQFDFDYLASKRGEAVVRRIRDLGATGAIELYPTGLADRDYRSLFCSLDLIVLPYSQRYRDIGSGVLLEAIYAGVVPILPAGSELDRLYRALGGAAPVLPDLSPGSIRYALAGAVRRVDELKCSALEVRENWRRHPSAAEQWQSELSAWLAEKA